jgi:hypothetical protein
MILQRTTKKRHIFYAGKGIPKESQLKGEEKKGGKRRRKRRREEKEHLPFISIAYFASNL